MIRDREGVRAVGDGVVVEENLVLLQALRVRLDVERGRAVEVECRVDVVCGEALPEHLDGCTWIAMRRVTDTRHGGLRTSEFVRGERAVLRSRRYCPVIALRVRAQRPSSTIRDRRVPVVHDRRGAPPPKYSPHDNVR